MRLIGIGMSVTDNFLTSFINISEFQGRNTWFERSFQDGTFSEPSTALEYAGSAMIGAIIGIGYFLWSFSFEDMTLQYLLRYIVIAAVVAMIPIGGQTIALWLVTFITIIVIVAAIGAVIYFLWWIFISSGNVGIFETDEQPEQASAAPIYSNEEYNTKVNRLAAEFPIESEVLHSKQKTDCVTGNSQPHSLYGTVSRRISNDGLEAYYLDTPSSICVEYWSLNQGVSSTSQSDESTFLLYFEDNEDTAVSQNKLVGKSVHVRGELISGLRLKYYGGPVFPEHTVIQVTSVEPEYTENDISNYTKMQHADVNSEHKNTRSEVDDITDFQSRSRSKIRSRDWVFNSQATPIPYVFTVSLDSQSSSVGNASYVAMGYWDTQYLFVTTDNHCDSSGYFLFETKGKNTFSDRVDVFCREVVGHGLIYTMKYMSKELIHTLFYGSSMTISYQDNGSSRSAEQYAFSLMGLTSASNKLKHDFGSLDRKAQEILIGRGLGETVEFRLFELMKEPPAAAQSQSHDTK